MRWILTISPASLFKLHRFILSQQGDLVKIISLPQECCGLSANLYQCYQTHCLGARLGYFWLPRRGQQSLTATSLLLGYFWLPGREMSWNRAPLWKIVNSGGFWTFSTSMNRFYRQLIGLRRHTEPPKVIILNFRSWIIYRFSAQLGDFWLIGHIKTPKIRHLGAFLLDEKLGYF